jgi:hypothetical protein
MIRDRALVAEFATAYIGVLLFAYLWNFPGHARHHGVLFLMLIASVWISRVRDPRRTRRSRLWTALLVVNAVAGLMTLFSELRPFSQGRNVAAWLQQNNLDDAFLLGSRDTPTSTVAGYLRRPIYYLECECLGTFIVWNTRRQAHLPPAEFGRRLVRALDGSTRRDAILIVNRKLRPEAEAAATPRLSFTMLQAFQGAAVTDENYVVYRVAVQSTSKRAARTPG